MINEMKGNKMAEKIKRFTISVDDTWNGESFKWMSDDEADAIRKADRLVASMKSGNAIVRWTNDEDVILHYCEK